MYYSVERSSEVLVLKFWQVSRNLEETGHVPMDTKDSLCSQVTPNRQERSDSSSSTAAGMKDEGKIDMSSIIPWCSYSSTTKSNMSKPPSSCSCLARKPSPVTGSARKSKISALPEGLSVSSSSSFSARNTAEVHHFETKKDSSFWIQQKVSPGLGNLKTRFTFDHVACETVDQETLFRIIGVAMVENSLSGYNCCMLLAYGQAGSGKTYTMLGEIEQQCSKPSLNCGMVSRIFDFLFRRIRSEEESRMDQKLKFNCKCPLLEIYNEQIIDLLDTSPTSLLVFSVFYLDYYDNYNELRYCISSDHHISYFMLREDTKKGVYVENLSELRVQAVGDILELLRQGSLNKKVAATNTNKDRSLSPSILTGEIQSMWEKDSSCYFHFVRLNLIDLAGLERQQKAFCIEAEPLKEACINESLFALSHVIKALVNVANGSPRHLPYRDSRLTFLLKFNNKVWVADWLDEELVTEYQIGGDCHSKTNEILREEGKYSAVVAKSSLREEVGSDDGAFGSSCRSTTNFHKFLEAELGHAKAIAAEEDTKHLAWFQNQKRTNTQ
nr:kinesin-like protein KIN-12D [Coffea arabica]